MDRDIITSPRGWNTQISRGRGRNREDEENRQDCTKGLKRNIQKELRNVYRRHSL